MSLDDMIKATPSAKGKGRGGRAGESSGRGGAMKKSATKSARAAAAPYSRPTLSSMYDMAPTKPAPKVVGLTTGTKLQVGNLDHNVTLSDMEVRRDVHSQATSSP